MNPDNLKYISLLTLTVQNSMVSLSMRYATTRDGPIFFSSTAVFMAEITKLLTCLVLVFLEEGTMLRFKASLYNAIVKNKTDTLKMTVPSLIYVLQNNLLYISAANLDAATYQVTYQLKILTTAMFAVFMLRKKLFSTQWGSLFILVCGVALVQLSAGGENRVVSVEQNRTLGFAAALGACVLSGFAGIFFEKMLKTSDLSVWMRNIQLSLLSLPLSLITSFANDGAKISDKGFFYGYDSFVYFLVLLQAGGGLIVAVVVKYADNILKGFATSLAIVLSCIVSIYLFNFELTTQFAFGTILVIVSIFLYGHDPTKGKSVKKVSTVKDDEEKLLGGDPEDV